MRIPAFKLSFQVETDNACGVISSAIIRQNEFDQICVSIPTGCILTNVMKFRSQYSVFWYDHDLRASNVRERTITLRIRYQCNWVIIDPLVVANSD